MSAQRASGTPSADFAHVRIPGSDRTYAVRDVLRGMGLRWDPVSHAWHGTLPLAQRPALARQYGLKPQIVPTIEAFGASEGAPEPPVRPRSPVPAPYRHDGSRTRAAARLAFPEGVPEETENDSRRFSLWEITSGLPDDSRDADERLEAHRVRDIRGRVKAARAMVATTPGLAEALKRDWRKAAGFHARFGITEAELRNGVPPARPEEV
ncbi:MAG: hypothetical protein L3K23_02125 [Thermoplasmata archaeon]|nr:hypothetical protein [Thermoplasmata archaeon]